MANIEDLAKVVERHYPGLASEQATIEVIQCSGALNNTFVQYVGTMGESIGAGSIANALGYADIASTCLGVAALFGIGDTVRTAQNQ